MWIGNYKITMKSVLSREQRHRRQICELKTKTDEKHAGRSILMYKLDLKAANVGQTDRQTHTHKVSTPSCACAPSINHCAYVCIQEISGPLSVPFSCHSIHAQT